MFCSCALLLSGDRRTVCPFEKIVDRNVEIIRKGDECFVIRLAHAGLIPADAVLRQAQVHGQLQLGYAALFAQFF